jgi:hypothetical protein
MTPQGHTDDFDIGKAIFDQLKDLPADRQQRVLRWVSEGLGVPLGVGPATSASAPQVLARGNHQRPNDRRRSGHQELHCR